MKLLPSFRRLCAYSFAALLSTQCLAADWITHDSSWNVVGKELVIQIRTLTNPTGEDSGPLFLALYAQSGTVYEGGNPGKPMARIPIDSIPANSRVDNVQVTSRVKLPRKGLQYTALIVERQNGKVFDIVDWVAFTSTYAFPRKQDGGVGSEDAAIGVGDIALGEVMLSLVGRKAEFRIDKLQNQRPIERTGLLRAAFYATPAPYQGEPFETPPLGVRELGELAPGDYFHSLQTSIPLKKPKPRGVYYLTFAVEEATESGYVPVAFWSETEPREF